MKEEKKKRKPMERKGAKSTDTEEARAMKVKKSAESEETGAVEKDKPTESEEPNEPEKEKSAESEEARALMEKKKSTDSGKESCLSSDGIGFNVTNPNYEDMSEWQVDPDAVLLPNPFFADDWVRGWKIISK